MVEKILRNTSKKTWYKWSVYINVLLFLILAIFMYLLIEDCLRVGCTKTSREYLLIVRDVAFIAIAVALIFFQFFKNLFTIIKRSL
jgi:hypothetical protein